MAGKCSVSPKIFVSRPDVINLNSGVDYEILGPALDKAAKAATEIVILGGYYSVAPLISLCKNVPKGRRKTCRIRIAVGLDGSLTIPNVWEDMQCVRDELAKLGFKKLKIAIVDGSSVHFHTKLYSFLHTTRRVWFIGSSNPGSKRHELMTRLSGKHDALASYVEAVFKKATDTNTDKPKLKLTNLREFFLSGMLCHKPPAQRLFTFDAFHFDSSHRERLDSALAGTSGVRHASPKTEGFGFDLRSPLSQYLVDIDGDEESGTEIAGRTQYRPYSVETVYGWWMPKEYAEKIKSKILQDEKIKANQLTSIGKYLSVEGDRALILEAFASYVASMTSFLKTHRIDAKPINNFEFKFNKFLDDRSRLLSNEASLFRHSRCLTLTRMPDIWTNERSVDDFTQSFFDYVAYRSSGNEKPRAVKSILTWLDNEDLSTPSDFLEAMETKLKLQPWTSADWEKI